jgi:hypothetical protein
MLFSNFFFISTATHLDITVAIEENKVEISVITFFNYAVLAEVSFCFVLEYCTLSLELTTTIVILTIFSKFRTTIFHI